jgi:hypothetical protein
MNYPTKDAIMHLYWNKTGENTSPKSIPTKLASDKTNTTKWLAKQTISKTKTAEKKKTKSTPSVKTATGPTA